MGETRFLLFLDTFEKFQKRYRCGSQKPFRCLETGENEKCLETGENEKYLKTGESENCPNPTQKTKIQGGITCNSILAECITSHQAC